VSGAAGAAAGWGRPQPRVLTSKLLKEKTKVYKVRPPCRYYSPNPQWMRHCCASCGQHLEKRWQKANFGAVKICLPVGRQAFLLKEHTKINDVGGWKLV